MINATDIALVFHPVSDLARSRRFYEEILGLKPLNLSETEGGPMIEYAVGTGRLAIGQMDMFLPSGDGVVAVLEVADFDLAVALLNKAGIEFYMEPFESAMGELALILDPDGSKIGIFRRTEAAS